jgi:hypothetical protein
MDYLSVNVIADRIKRHPLLEDIPFETIVDHAIEFIKIIGVPASFIEKTAWLKVEDYRAELPCDFYSMIQARTDRGDYFRGTNDSFHMSPDKNKEGNMFRKNGITYKIQGNVIFTSMPECHMEIAYRALPMDEDGYPLVPDNGSYPRALQEYIKMQCFTVLFDQGKIQPQVLQNTQQQYAFYVGQAKNDLVRPSMDQMVSISNMWNRLLPSKKDYNNGFVTIGAQEFLKRH